jgi:hemoglobin/transferrin/lactoferrin receptor protein
MGKLNLAATLFTLLFSAGAVAQANSETDGATEAQPHELDTISVIANKSTRPLGDIAGTVSVITDQQMGHELTQDIKDLVRYEPGISVRNDPNRFGLGGFNIRGVDGNRIAIEIDGVPAADSFAIGSFSDAGRNYIDPETLRRVEILRGPASTLYGSDAIGGVVTFTTKDPADYLLESGGDWYLGAKTGYNGDDNSTLATVTMAYGNDRWQTMLLASRRNGDELDNPLTSNPRDYEDTNMIGKIVLQTDAHNQLRFSWDYSSGESKTDIQSLVHGPGRFASTSLLMGDDHKDRHRYSLDYEFGSASALFDKATIRGYHQQSKILQNTLQHLDPSSRSPDPTSRQRSFRYDQKVDGGEMIFEKNLSTKSTSQQLVYGMEIDRVTTNEFRDGILTNLTTGTTSNVIIGETFPVRDFPESKTVSYGLYIQDEISPFANGLTIIPGLRYDYYDLDAKADAVFVEDNPDTMVTDASAGRLSPKLGMLLALGEDWTLFAQYAHGFRAPPFDDINIGFTIPLFGFKAIPNPDLKPETSNGIELGLRFAGENSSGSFVTYYNEYDNFIDSRVNLGIDPVSGLLIFQSLNRDDARIYGAELRTEHDLAAIAGWVEGFTLHTALAWTRGDDTGRDQPLSSVGPPSAVVGLAFDKQSGDWGLEFVITATQKQDRTDNSNIMAFQSPGYAVIDLIGYLNLGRKTRINWGLFNLADRTYWEWVDVAGLPQDDPLLGIYARPGRNASISLSHTF